jgi:GR25 family glycosyltransferase involved in LPS biosynthesis
MNNIDKIYCINLKHRPERKKLFTKRLKNTKVFPIENVKFIEAVDGNSLDSVPDPFNEGWPGNTKGAYGCLKSHVAAIKDASKNQYTRVLIFEDDVTFHKNFTDMFKKVSINIPAY